MAETGLRIRIDDELRMEFIQTCRGNDQTAAQVLRAFMREYIQTEKRPAPARRGAAPAASTHQKK